MPTPPRSMPLSAFGVWFVILAGFSPIPFKVITIAAGALGMPVFGFRAGSDYWPRGTLLPGRWRHICWRERAADNLRDWVDTLGWVVVGLTTGGVDRVVAMVSKRCLFWCWLCSG
jgi:hypothetical protein